jgi:hypothetical protein
MVENFDVSIICAFLKTSEVRSWSVKWWLLLVLTPCTEELVWKRAVLFIIKFINENMYSDGRGRISNLLNRPVQEFHVDWKGLWWCCINSQNYYVFDLGPSSGILITGEHNVSETGSVPILRWGRRHLLCWVPQKELTSITGQPMSL